MDALTTGQVARVLGVSINTVKSWISRGELNASRLPSGHFRIPRQELDRLVRRSQRWRVHEAHRATDDHPSIDASLEWMEAVAALGEAQGPLPPPDIEGKVRRLRRLHDALAHLSR